MEVSSWENHLFLWSIFHTWWLIPLSKWVITPVINGISRVNPLITGVITHLLSGMNHQVAMLNYHRDLLNICWTIKKNTGLLQAPPVATCFLQIAVKYLNALKGKYIECDQNDSGYLYIYICQTDNYYREMDGYIYIYDINWDMYIYQGWKVNIWPCRWW